jgi:hypothetical protein
MMKVLRLAAVALALGNVLVAGGHAAGPSDETGLQSLNTTGQLTIQGRSVQYIIRRLPADSFPDLPVNIQAELARRECLIPQTYEAHRPENVVRGSFERPGSSDWAVLCSSHGTVSLLVFFASRPGEPPFVLASAPETERLQAHLPDTALGFNWAIDAASPQDVHEAQAGLEPRPPALEHDALADSTVDHRTVYHFYAKNAWTLPEMPQE